MLNSGPATILSSMPNVDTLPSIPNGTLNVLPPPPPSHFGIREKNTSPNMQSKIHLINAIELERRNYALQKLRLTQLHSHNTLKVKALKSEADALKRDINLLTSAPSQHEVKGLLQKNEVLHDSYLRQRALRLQDEEQLQQTNKENQKLLIIIFYLKQELETLTKNYQQLCDKKIYEQIPNSKVMNNANYNNRELERAETESSVTPNAANLPPEIASAINDDPWFGGVIEENRMLERHIRFLRHIIDEEARRYNFKEIILGQSSVDTSTAASSPRKITHDQNTDIAIDHDDIKKKQAEDVEDSKECELVLDKNIDCKSPESSAEMNTATPHQKMSRAKKRRRRKMKKQQNK